MYEYIGEHIRAQVLAPLTWVSRPAGLVEILEVKNGEKNTKFPGAKPYYGVNCEPGDYLNMSPDGKETCIAFVDSSGEIRVDQHTTHFDRISAFFRVVVWYDEKKIRYDGALDISARMTQEIVNLAKSANLNNAGIGGCKVIYESLTTDPAKIWGVYGFKPDDQLFMLPYRTFAVSFRMTAFLSGACQDYSIQVQSVC